MDCGSGRQDRVEADLRCLMCSRVIGQLYGLVQRNSRGHRAARSTVYLTEFRPSRPGAPNVPVAGRGQLRCPDCGGIGVLDEISVIPVGESLLVDDACPIHRERVHGRGRRPRGCQCRELPAAA
jgi:hypothetical protein